MSVLSRLQYSGYYGESSDYEIKNRRIVEYSVERGERKAEKVKSNFEFLSQDFPVLANFGKLAEQYLFSDSNSCLMKLGMIGETIVNLMFTYDKIPLPYDNTAVSRIDTLQREELLTRDLTDILHALRKARNKAVHENYSSVTVCKSLLQMAHSLCEWFMQTYGDWNYQHHEFVMPTQVQKKIAVATEAIKTAEDKTADALTQKAMKKATVNTVSKAEHKKQGSKMASQRQKSEAETRYMIDEQLRQVGWEADTGNLRYSKGTRPKKGRNLAIAEWPTDSTVGINGRADYALFVGLKLYAIIEAKAEHKDISSVIDYQGKDYPRNIRVEDQRYVIGNWGNYKVPFTFATNGRPYLEQYKTKSGIWFLDLRNPSNVPQALHGWFSPVGIEEKFEKDNTVGNAALKAMAYDFLTDKEGLNLREYQVNAIKAAEQAIIKGKKTALLAMATGTGKTRTVLGMIYRFLKTNRFKRILFLVDRTSLGEQATDVFKEVKIEDLMTLDEIYNINSLNDKIVDKETRIQVATVQSMVKRILYNDDEVMPAVTDYDLIIVDEAHNILSTTSIRESEEWKDYRLECFEEIIKEGRKFGTFLTISSQRPSDISDTIISQLHNYFIHRLVNEEDLRKIHRTIAFSDKSTNDMISILPAGGCIFTGLASNFPVLARINILPEANQPRSENVDISKIWY